MAEVLCREKMEEYCVLVLRNDIVEKCDGRVLSQVVVLRYCGGVLL